MTNAFRSAAFWRAFLLTLCALGLALCIVDPMLDLTSSGVILAGTNAPGLQKIVRVLAGSPAERAGIRAGQIIDIRPMPASQRYELYNPALRGKPLTLYLVRPSGLQPVQIAPRPTYTSLRWDVRVAYAGLAWMLLFAALLAIRRPDDCGARTLAGLLTAISLGSLLMPVNLVTPWPWLDALAYALCFVLFIPIALLSTYALGFARPASVLRRALTFASYAVACACAAAGVVSVSAQWFGFIDPSIFTDSWGMAAINALPFVLPLLCGAIAAAQTRGAERSRFLWAFVPLALMYASQVLDDASHSTVYARNAFHVADNVLAFVAPLGLTYSLLTRRVLDIGFVLNRAVVFSGVSIVLVGTFVIVEWALGEWMSGVSHEANIAVSGALALVLGLSMRFVHSKVEHFVDNVMFRKRREDEEAILRMAREAPYITDRATLLERTKDTLLRHVDASHVDIVLDEGRGRYGCVDENDPALVSLRADHARVDLHALDTAVEGEWAYPMVARGRLVGALVLGPKNSQESYAPDESAAIAQLANSVAGALDLLGSSQDHTVLHELRDLRAAVNTIAARLDGAAQLEGNRA